MFFRKKKPEPVTWELEDEYRRQLAILERKDIGWTFEDYDRQLKTVLLLEAKKREFEEAHKAPEKKRVSPDGWLAAGVTVILGAAPYLIEKTGHLAGHLKGKVQGPRLWK